MMVNIFAEPVLGKGYTFLSASLTLAKFTAFSHTDLKDFCLF